jgi:hypothetical protein
MLQLKPLRSKVALACPYVTVEIKTLMEKKGYFASNFLNDQKEVRLE